MGSFNQLVIGLARELSMTTSAVEPYALALREARILPETERGRGAQPANCLDAAKLLIAMLSNGPASSPEFVRRVGALVMRGKPPPSCLKLGLNAGMQFADAIAAVVSSIA